VAFNTFYSTFLAENRVNHIFSSTILAELLSEVPTADLVAPAKTIGQASMSQTQTIAPSLPILQTTTPMKMESTFPTRMVTR
jgi:hypothetical protein